MREAPLKFMRKYLGIAQMGGVSTLARMVWGTFFGDEVPQSARLSAGGGGGAKAIRAMPKCLQHVFEEGFPNYGL